MLCIVFPCFCPCQVFTRANFLINRQIENILFDAGVSVSAGENLTFSINPYYYEISVNGNVTEEKRKQIEGALNQ